MPSKPPFGTAAFFAVTALFTAAAGAIHPLPGQVTPELVLQIGQEVGDADNTFFDISDIAVSAVGTIYVLDMAAQRVKAFDQGGHLLRQFGRTGRGPGEFVSPVGIAVDSIVRVFDPSLAREVHFDTTGGHIRTRRLQVPQGVYPQRSWSLRGGYQAVNTRGRFSFGAEHHNPYFSLLLVDPQPAIVDTLASFHTGGSIWAARGERLPWGVASSQFGRGGAWAIAGDSVLATVNGYTGRVQWIEFDSGGIRDVTVFNLPVASRPISKDDIEALERDLLQKYRGNPDFPRKLDIYAPPAWSGATGAVFDDRGQLWIEIPQRGGPRTASWVVMDESGRTDTVTLNDLHFDLKAVRGGYLYGVGRTPLDAEVVLVLRMEP